MLAGMRDEQAAMKAEYRRMEAKLREMEEKLRLKVGLHLDGDATWRRTKCCGQSRCIHVCRMYYCSAGTTAKCFHTCTVQGNR